MAATDDSPAAGISRDEGPRAPRGEADRGDGAFATTRWSLIREAGYGEGSAACEALAVLCEAYWYPLYAYVRRRGRQPAEAQDLTQAFFVHLLEGKALAVADPQRGRFRSFLLQSLKNFMATERRRQRARKRGGNRQPLPLDFESGEDRYRREPVDADTPERLFQRRWALTLLEESLAALRGEYESSGRGALFAALQPHLQGGSGALSYAELGASLGMSEGAVKVAAHRLRRRYREILRGTIAQTVSSPAEIDEELRELMGALAP
jgi:RNA polymerase sigma factor (sigma-70 family)